jgi:O-antigen ligase
LSSAGVHPSDLEPALVAARTYATRRWRARIDAGTVISLMVCLLFTIPSSQILPQLTIAGRPALVLALGLFAWWVISRLSPWLVMVGPQPLRWAAMVYLLSILLSYFAGLLRGLPTLEANRQDFTLLVTFEFLGVMLMTADGLRNWERFWNVLRVFVWCAGFMAVVGLIQSILKIDVAQYLTLPGLHKNVDLAGFETRGTSGNVRVASTATHYIEFGTVMAMAVPFAIHFAKFAPTSRSRTAYGILALLSAAVIPMTISRTGIVALFGALAVMFVSVWGWRMRYNIMVVAIVLMGGLVVGKPGLLGTLRSMFLASSESDNSIQGRTDDYSYVARWFAERPWLGRGPGTLIPDLYLVLDNQWLLTLVTGGLIGVAAMAALHITCISLAGIALRRSTRPADRHICAALISSQVVAILVAATFDSFSFTTFSFTLALMSGLAGAVWRFTHPARTVRTARPRWLVERAVAPNLRPAPRTSPPAALTETGHRLVRTLQRARPSNGS